MFCAVCNAFRRQFEDDESQKSELVPRLAAKKMHLPGYTWLQDFVQYQFNSHPVFGIILHHPFHPVTRLERFVIFIGTLAFGYLFSLLVYENSAYGSEATYEATKEELVGSLQDQLTQDQILSGELPDLPDGALSVGVVYLNLFFVGLVQTLFVEILWKLQACSCFKPGGCFSSRMNEDNAGKCCIYFGNAIVFVTVLALVALVIVMMLARCEEDSDDICPLTDTTFWILYLYQVATVTMFDFVKQTVMFSGVISYFFCDSSLCMKFFGGRRAELKEEQELEKQEE